MKLLAIDSATEACSAAVWIDGAVLARYEVIGRGHAERLLPMVDELLAESGLRLQQLDALAFGRGPGAFTGIRIGVGLAQGLAFGADLPLVPVSSLAALARLALDTYAVEAGPPRGEERAVAGLRAGDAIIGAAGPRALVCLDARMNEVYWAEACGRPDGGVELVAERLGTAASVELSAAAAALPLIGAGHGWAAHPAMRESFPQLVACWPELLPRAHEIAALAALEVAAGRTVSAEDAAPVYLRDDVATRSGRGPYKTPAAP
jgi:tRNA threonylcarbamoyladenosine biosynthesis protein TsaB